MAHLSSLYKMVVKNRPSTVGLGQFWQKYSNCPISVSSFLWSAGDGRWRHHRRFPAADRWALLRGYTAVMVTSKPCPQPPPLSLYMAALFSFSQLSLLLLLLLLLFYFYRFLFEDVYELFYIYFFPLPFHCVRLGALLHCIVTDKTELLLKLLTFSQLANHHNTSLTHIAAFDWTTQMIAGVNGVSVLQLCSVKRFK